MKKSKTGKIQFSEVQGQMRERLVTGKRGFTGVVQVQRVLENQNASENFSNCFCAGYQVNSLLYLSFTLNYSTLFTNILTKE